MPRWSSVMLPQLWSRSVFPIKITTGPQTLKMWNFDLPSHGQPGFYLEHSTHRIPSPFSNPRLPRWSPVHSSFDPGQFLQSNHHRNSNPNIEKLGDQQVIDSRAQKLRKLWWANWENQSWFHAWLHLDWILRRKDIPKCTRHQCTSAKSHLTEVGERPSWQSLTDHHNDQFDFENWNPGTIT